MKKINFFTYLSLLYFQNYFFTVLVPVPDLAKHFSTVWFLCRFQQVDVNLGLGYKNLTLNCRLLPFKQDTLTTLVKTSKFLGLLLHIIKVPSLDYQGFLRPNLTVLGLNTSSRRTLAQKGQPTSIGAESAKGPDYASTACFFSPGLPICRSKMCLTHFRPAQTPVGSCCEHLRPVIVT